jgi:YD repeat-containing protein
MLDQPSLKNLQPPALPKRRIARRLMSMVIVLCGMLMALESIFGGQMTRQFRADEANEELRFAVSVGNSLRTLNPSDGASPTEFARSGLKEEISDKYKERYEKWKGEYLSTEAGRNQWEMYEHKKRFLLTIRISKENPRGARTDYEWNDSGELIAATITLGSRIDEGYPCSFYYPVLGLLKAHWYPNVKSMLAAGKIAHEFGHVNRAIADDKFQRQNRLSFAYTRIFIAGHDIRDSRLTELEQLGATPVEIWADRECSAEANALLYLREKAAKGFVSRSLITRIAKNIELNAKHCARCFVPELLLPIMTIKR